MEFEKYKDKGLTGLANLGNTCFINSCMQILSHTYLLNKFLENKQYKKRLNNKCDSILLIEWDKLRELMWSENCLINPAGWIQCVQKIAKAKDNILFTEFAQNDVPEFLIFLIDGFHNALKREVEMSITGKVENNTDKVAKCCYEMIKKMYKNEYSEILTMFYGIHVSKIINIDNGEILSMRPESFFTIDLHLKNNDEDKECNIYDCLDDYYSFERLSGDNMWLNDKTNKKQEVDKCISVWSFPDIVIISLKRFVNFNKKDSRLVTFPLTDLDLRKYSIGYDKESYIYDLYAIANHEGGMNGGHYTANILNANGNWYNFNDTNISKIDKDISNKLVIKQAYCLFYRKKKII